jgi:anti-anti-sigma factor
MHQHQGPLQILVTRAGAAAVMRVVGELDMTTAPQLEAELFALVGARITVDLGRCTFLDSSGMYVLTKAHQQMEAIGGELLLRSPRPIVRRVLEMTGRDENFTVEPDEDE